MPYQLLYRSKVARHIRLTDVEKIVEKSSQRNETRDLTGALAYTATHFVQVLEGEKETVQAVFEKIASDKRHSEVVVIAQGDIEERRFGDWGMRIVLSNKETNASAIEDLDEERTILLLSS